MFLFCKRIFENGINKRIFTKYIKIYIDTVGVGGTITM
nr:MAG TPA: hypothetical protein [Caudoviricetes sp.]